MTNQTSKGVHGPNCLHNLVRRYLIAGNYRGENAGSWETCEWYSDRDIVRRAVKRTRNDPVNESVRVIVEERRPNGRWGKRRVRYVTMSNNPVRHEGAKPRSCL